MLFIVHSSGQETVLDTDTLQVWCVKKGTKPVEQVGPLIDLAISQFKEALDTYASRGGRLITRIELAEYATRILPESCQFSWSGLQVRHVPQGSGWAKLQHNSDLGVWVDYLSPQPSAAPGGQ